MTVPTDPRPEPATGYEPPPAVGPAPLTPPASPFPPSAFPQVGPPPPSESVIVLDVVLRVFGVPLAFAGGVMTAALALLLVPLRLGSFGWPDGGGVAALRVPVAIVVAVAGNLFLVWFARNATGLRWFALLPGAGWFTVVVLALRTTTEGDRLLVPDDWVGSLTLFGGTITLVIATVLAISSAGRPRGGRPAGR
jgi:hypothetical protein